MLGLAGPAGASLAAGSGLLCVGVFLTIMAAFIGLLLRSRLATILSAAGTTCTALLFRPWGAF